MTSGAGLPEWIVAILYGKGRALMPFHDKARDGATYYYEEATLEGDRRLFLFVFFNEGAHGGYMWFSRLEKQ